MISVIVAVAQNGVIGCDNSLLWHISEDLQRFKAITSGHPVIMGRLTFESLGRPLPNRTNVVISRRKDYAPEGVIVAGSPEEAVAMFPSEEEIFVIGGADIYRQMLPFADKLYLTNIKCDYAGDAIFPEIDENDWERASCESFVCGKSFEHPFEYINYVRKK